MGNVARFGRPCRARTAANRSRPEASRSTDVGERDDGRRESPPAAELAQVGQRPTAFGQGCALRIFERPTETPGRAGAAIGGRAPSQADDDRTGTALGSRGDQLTHTAARGSQRIARVVRDESETADGSRLENRRLLIEPPQR
jgi:hypothetical protein